METSKGPGRFPIHPALWRDHLRAQTRHKPGIRTGIFLLSQQFRVAIASNVGQVPNLPNGSLPTGALPEDREETKGMTVDVIPSVLYSNWFLLPCVQLQAHPVRS